jgi:Virulence-associated protein E
MVTRAARFRKSSPCPICNGYDEAPRGTGQRCYGYLSDDGRFAHCVRDEHAGRLTKHPDSNTYAHTLVGNCACGVRHDPTTEASPRPQRQGNRRQIAVYHYVDAQGTLLYDVVRFWPKGFAQRRPDGQGGWLWNLDSVPRVPYQLPEILAAVQAGTTIFIPEGERDCLTLRQKGLIATTNSEGAGKWRSEFAAHFAGAHVVVLPDNDAEGRAHADKLIASLLPVAASLKRVELPDLPEKGDVSDWFKAGHTVEELLALVAQAPSLPLGNGDGDGEPQDEPGGRVIRNERKQLISCQHNGLVWLQQHGHGPKIWLDTFQQAAMVDGQPLADEVVIELVRQMEASTMVHWAQAHVQSAIVSLASRQPRSSLTTWLDSLTWDGKKRLRTFFSDAYGAEVTDYTAACADVFFGSAVARAYAPGCQADVTVVLIGDQGIGKSKGIAELVPNPAWYTDDLGGDLYDRKAAEGLQGKWLIEFGEFARINRATLDVVKAFLSRRVDHYRPAYGRMAKDFPRQCIFIGTTNNPMPLQDLENRRFMPVYCPKEVADIAALRDQLWAEAVQRYKAGERWWITDKALLQTVKERQDDARQHDEWEEFLRTALRGLTEVTLADVASRLGITVDRLDKSTQIRLGLTMKALGFMRRRDSSAERAYYWVREDSR